jgi:putative transcriptional regulator
VKKELFDTLVLSIKQVGAIRRGEMRPSRVHHYTAQQVAALRAKYRPVHVVNARKRLGLSQADFAAVMGIGKATLQSWEQGRRIPTGPAFVLLRVAERDPKVVLRALQPKRSGSHQ